MRHSRISFRAFSSLPLVSHLALTGILGSACTDQAVLGAPAIYPSRVSISTEGPGSHCATGGQRLESGLDADLDGLLDPDEVAPSLPSRPLHK